MKGIQMLKSVELKSIFRIVLVLALTAGSQYGVAQEGDGSESDSVESEEAWEDDWAPETEQVYEDRFEGFNRAVFSFNEYVDKYALKPVAQGYRYITPDIVDEGITNVFNNIDDVETFANSLLQGKFHNAMVSLNRVIYNTIFGIFGIFDVATVFGLEADEEDFGQTLAAWGYEESSYLMLPFFGPSTVRDFSGFLVDTTVFDALDYIDELNEDERRMLLALEVVDIRADIIAAENFDLGGDKYEFLRNLYLQHRAFLINDGDVEDSFADEEFDDLEGF